MFLCYTAEKTGYVMTCRLELKLFATCAYQEKEMLVFWKILRLYEMNDTYKCGNSARQFFRRFSRATCRSYGFTDVPVAVSLFYDLPSDRLIFSKQLENRITQK